MKRLFRMVSLIIVFVLSISLMANASNYYNFGNCFYVTIPEIREDINRNMKEEYSKLPELNTKDNQFYSAFITDSIITGFIKKDNYVGSAVLTLSKENSKNLKSDINKFSYYCGLYTAIFEPYLNYEKLIEKFEMENFNTARTKQYTYLGTLFYYEVTDNSISFAVAPYQTEAIKSLPQIIIDGKVLELDTKPFIYNNRCMVPLRGIFEKLGAKVVWDGANQQVTAKKGDTIIQLKVDNETAYVNGSPVTLDAPALNRESRVSVPVRFVAETLKADVQWIGSLQTVYIITKEPKTIKVKQPITIDEYIDKVENYNPPTISMEEFSKIKNGMTYNEVKEIIGSEGELLSESGAPGSPYYTVMYAWDGSGSLGANAIFMFQGGKLISKSQMGLK